MQACCLSALKIVLLRGLQANARLKGRWRKRRKKPAKHGGVREGR